MRKLLFGLALLLIPVSGFAQTPAPSAEEMSVNVNWQNLQTSVIALLQANNAHTAETAALKQRLSDLDAYLKLCADQAGCTVPAK